MEIKDQLESLKNIDCDIIQGYYFGRLLPEDEAADILGTKHMKSSENKS